MQRLRVTGTFEVHDGCTLEEAIFRLSVRLKQISGKNPHFQPELPDDWKGLLELVDE